MGTGKENLALLGIKHCADFRNKFTGREPQHAPKATNQPICGEAMDTYGVRCRKIGLTSASRGFSGHGRPDSARRGVRPEG